MSETIHAAEPVADVAFIRERLVIAPRSGRFEPLPPENFTCEGEWVERGQVLGLVQDGVSQVPVTSAFRGWVMGMLAIPGQPIHKGEALFWIRGC